MLLTALLSIVCSVAAQFLLKAGMSSPGVKLALADGFGARAVIGVLFNPYVFAGFSLYGLGAIIWLKVLSQADVSKAYPLVGLGFVLTLMVGVALGEQVGILRILGTILICGGVWLVSSS